MKPISTVVSLACRKIYPPIAIADFIRLYVAGETVVGTALIDGIFYVCHQGTKDWPGWIADAEIIPFYHPVLGNLHSGFYKNLPGINKKLIPDIPPTVPVVVIGHSKGAGEGVQNAALLKLAGINVVRVILFAAPRAGYQRFTDWCTENMPGISFRNASKEFPEFGDPVPLVPEEPYVDQYPHTIVEDAPEGFKEINILEWHLGEYYEKACVTWENAQ